MLWMWQPSIAPYNSWKTTQMFKTLCYLYSFSTLFKREKDLQIDRNQKVFKLGLYTKNYGHAKSCTRLYLLHYSMIFIRLELKYFGINNLFQIDILFGLILYFYVDIFLNRDCVQKTSCMHTKCHNFIKY